MLQITNRIITLFFLLSISVPVIAAQPVDNQQTGKVTGAKESTPAEWFKESFLEIHEDVAEATDDNKHLMLFVHYTGCPYCYKMLEENIKHSPYTDFIKQNFDVVMINMLGDREIMLDETTSMTEKELADELNVIYTPTILFFDAENNIVARTNGYRSVKDFKLVLNYVANKDYREQSFAQYLNDNKQSVYKFRDNPQLKSVTQLNKYADKPLAVLFEDTGCFDCDALHDGHLADPEVQKILENYTFVRLDALSDKAITDIDGNATTPKALAEKIGLTYRPAIVLYDRGKEVMRIQSMLYSYHFSEVLRYVGERHYEEYDEFFSGYLAARTTELINKGQDVSVSDE